MKKNLSSSSSKNHKHDGHEHNGVTHHNPSGVVATLTALGVVFGDIGTSPLYALRECFSGQHGYPPNPANIFGILSLFFWSLNIVISLKYVLFIMHADNRGEGGILALESLARRSADAHGFKKLMPQITLLGLFGSALLYGDGIITPAISVLSALEGLSIATSFFDNMVQPLTVVILISLFAVQRLGTAKIGAVFGPITLVWFLAMGILGLCSIVLYPSIIAAVNPFYAFQFFYNNGITSLLVLGTVFLCVTGGEAMYADMGHFGRLPIKRGWFFISLPCLTLNYFGQGALILSDPAAVSNPFYLLAPDWALYPLVALATMATVIASQALISGVFSLTRQAVQLGYAPRMEILHTSKDSIGQVYVPVVNWSLLIGSIWLVLTFKSSSAMAHAYGIAVSLTMLITTLLAMVVARYIWTWSILLILLVCVPLLIIDSLFFAANFTKFFDGGWMPILLACGIQLLATTWITGRQLVMKQLHSRSVDIDTFCKTVKSNPPIRVPGQAIFMTGVSSGTPAQLVSLLKTTKVIHEKIVFLTFQTKEVPYVPAANGIIIEQLAFENIWRVIVTVGYMETPDVQKTLVLCGERGLQLKAEDTTFFLGRDVVLPSVGSGMSLWRERLFAFMSRNAISPTMFYNIPPAMVVEVGLQIEI
jgi:KUP system potassium uptake protein